MAFQIYQKSRRTAFLLGFCESLKIRDNHLFPLSPFSRAQLFVPGGWIDCRGDWHGPRHLPIEGILVRSVPYEVWMGIPMVDAIRAIDLCCHCSIDLGRDGFNRVSFS